MKNSSNATSSVIPDRSYIIDGYSRTSGGSMKRMVRRPTTTCICGVPDQFPIVCHHRPVVEYRRHADNMSNNAGVMLEATLTALKKQRKHVEGNQELRAAYEVGRRHWKTYYGEPLIVSMYENIARGNVMRAACDCYTLVRLFPERFPIFSCAKSESYTRPCVVHSSSRMLKKGAGWLGRSPCSRNARPQKALVGRAQLGSSQPPLRK